MGPQAEKMTPNGSGKRDLVWIPDLKRQKMTALEGSVIGKGRKWGMGAEDYHTMVSETSVCNCSLENSEQAASRVQVIVKETPSGTLGTEEMVVEENVRGNELMLEDMVRLRECLIEHCATKLAERNVKNPQAAGTPPRKDPSSDETRESAWEHFGGEGDDGRRDRSTSQCRAHGLLVSGGLYSLVRRDDQKHYLCTPSVYSNAPPRHQP